MRRVLSLFSVFAFTLLVISSFVYPSSPVVREANAGDQHNVRGWIWGSNTGWISMNCLNEETCGISNYGVNIDEETGIMSGYAWNNPRDDVAGTDSVGWLSFNQSDLVGCPEGECIARRVGDALEGWARFLGGEDPNGGGLDEEDIYGEWSAPYDAPPNADTTPDDSEINEYVCVDGESGTYNDVAQVTPGNPGNPVDQWFLKEAIDPARDNIFAENINGGIYVSGGWANGGEPGGWCDRMENDIWDAESETWVSRGPLPQDTFDSFTCSTQGNWASASDGNTMWAFRDNIYEYDPGIDNWVQVDTLDGQTLNSGFCENNGSCAPTLRVAGASEAEYFDGKVWFFANVGCPYCNSDPLWSKQNERIAVSTWDPNTGMIDQSAPDIIGHTDFGLEPASGRSREVATVLNGRLYVVSGYDTGECSATGFGSCADGHETWWVRIHRLNLSGTGWEVVSTLEEEKWAYSVGSVGDRIYIIGGRNGGITGGPGPAPTNSEVYYYDIGSSSWGVADSLVQDVEHASVVTEGCELHVVGGYSSNGLSRMEHHQVLIDGECDPTGGGEPATYHDREVQCISEEAPDSSSGWDGWMKLSGSAVNGSYYGVTIDASESFEESYSWGDDVIGWVDWGPAWINTEDPQYELSVVKRGLGTGNVSSVPAGIDCGADCSEVYGDGTSVNLTAAADVGSAFEEYAGCTETGPNTCNTVMTQNRSVRALFVQNENTDSMCTDGLDNDEDGLIDNGGSIQPGDLNQDGDIDVADVLIVSGIDIGTEPTSAYRNIAGDVHPAGVGDGDVDADDAEYLNLVAVGLEPWPDLRSVGADPECAAEPSTFTLTTGVLDPEIGRRIAVLADQDGDGNYTLAANCLDELCEDIVTFSAGTPMRLSAIQSLDFVSWVEIDSGLCADPTYSVCEFTLDANTFIRGQFVGGEEICGDGIDNDGDGLIDEDCTEICGDGIDNDGDGLIDEGCPVDPDCPDCGGDDGDGNPELFVTVVENADPGEVRRVLVVEVGEGFVRNCYDVDSPCNDIDLTVGADHRLTAIGADFQYWGGDECNGFGGDQCEFTMGNVDVHITAYFGAAEDPPGCQPGEDDDGDGIPNELDPDCGAECPAGGVGVCPACNDNFDNDGDGLTDYQNDPGCSNNQFLDSEGSLDDIEEI